MCMCVCMCVGSHNPYTGDFGPFLSIHDGTIDFIQYRWGGGICYGGWGRKCIGITIWTGVLSREMMLFIGT
jgi:hypothetical protein